MRCHRVRFVVARAPGGPVCGTCWRREPTATLPCVNCATVTRLYHFGLCTACACPEVIRGLLTATDGIMRARPRRRCLTSSPLTTTRPACSSGCRPAHRERY